MTPLDILYGQGTAEAFAKHVNLATLFAGTTTTIEEYTSEDKSVHVIVTWRTAKAARIGIYELTYFPTYVYVNNLQIEPAFRGKGLLKALCKSLESFWVGLGLTENAVAVIPGSDGEKMLALCGFHTLQNGWGIELPATRLKEYVAWVNKGELPAEEPAWRTGLPRPVEEPF